MTLADLTVNTETMALISVVVGALSGVIGMLFREYTTQLKEERDTWKSIADGAVTSLEQTTNARRHRSGLPPLTEVAAVVPEHSSPTTKKQRDTAEMATIRARLTAAQLSEGLEPRTTEEEEKP